MPAKASRETTTIARQLQESHVFASFFLPVISKRYVAWIEHLLKNGLRDYICRLGENVSGATEKTVAPRLKSYACQAFDSVLDLGYLSEALMKESGTARADPTKRKDELCELMEAYQRGQISGFERLYTLLAPDLRRYLASLTWNRERTEDLLQETFLQLHRARHTYIPPRPVRPWVFAIARHCYLMDRRTFLRKRRAETSADEKWGEIPVPSELNGYTDIDAVRRALRDTPDDPREAVLLHYVWGFSYSEIGKMLGIGAGAAKLRAFRGIQYIREFLSKD
jgi:RNA polymerase sigma-70 factor (ECF subfamily)